MIICEKKDESIHVYSMEAKAEELKKYRKRILQKYKDKPLFYSIKTNRESTMKRIVDLERLNICSVDYDYYDPFGPGEYSRFQESGFNEEIKEKYLLGFFDNVKPTILFQNNYKFDRLEILHRLLITQDVEEKSYNIGYKSWEFYDLMDLPHELYLLQLLLLGKYDKLESENIKSQLKLFDINYLKSISIKDLKDIFDTGLIRDNLDNVINHAEIGSMILAKRK